MERRHGLIGPSYSAHGQASLGSRGNALGKSFLACFVAHCESYVQDVENTVLVIRVCCCSF